MNCEVSKIGTLPAHIEINEIGKCRYVMATIVATILISIPSGANAKGWLGICGCTIAERWISELGLLQSKIDPIEKDFSSRQECEQSWVQCEQHCLNRAYEIIRSSGALTKLQEFARSSIMAFRGWKFKSTGEAFAKVANALSEGKPTSEHWNTYEHARENFERNEFLNFDYDCTDDPTNRGPFGSGGEIYLYELVFADRGPRRLMVNQKVISPGTETVNRNDDWIDFRRLRENVSKFIGENRVTFWGTVAGTLWLGKKVAIAVLAKFGGGGSGNAVEGGQVIAGRFGSTASRAASSGTGSGRRNRSICRYS